MINDKHHSALPVRPQGVLQAVVFVDPVVEREDQLLTRGR